jgi:L-arabonate dehydrase
MEDFYYAGGLPVILRELGEAGLLHKDVVTVNGKTIWENVKNAECYNRKVINSFKQPFKPRAGIAVLRGNLAPNGAVIKPSAATPALLKHRGRAVVLETVEELHEKGRSGCGSRFPGWQKWGGGPRRTAGGRLGPHLHNVA